jgi:hypothetical protein
MLFDKYGARGLEILIVDASNRKDLTQDVADETSLTLPVLLDDQDISHTAYGVFATPTTLLVDVAGRIIFKHIGYGPGTEDMLGREIELLLEGKTT